ncbi:MAG: hypothetical protein ABFD60_16830 [Bryobacteraceae bacterium]
MNPDSTEGTSPEAGKRELYLEERKLLIDAARESSRTFDKAVLAFGSAAFGASVAFLKDVVPHPLVETVVWLEVSWLCFSLGILAILLSFLFSHRACFFEIERSRKIASGVRPDETNPWAFATETCNWVSVALLFLGILIWIRFVIANLSFP